jgi:APA family basic amino acid/polyamine antiporter
VKDPRRNVPRALILGVTSVIVIYLLANVAYLAIFPIDQLRQSPRIAADVAMRLIGTAGVVFVGVTVMISTFGTLNGTLLTSPRIFFAMADDGLFFKKVAAVAIIVTAGFNYVGVRWGALVQNVTTIAKYGGLLFIVLFALAVGFPEGASHFTPAVPPGSFRISAFGLALVSVLWAFDGWADLSFVAGEVKDPRRNVPRALILGVTSVIVIYLLANVAYLAIFPIDQLRQSPRIAADVAMQLIGTAGVVFVGVTVMLSTFGTLNGTLLTSPRIFFAMADDGLFFRKVAAVHPRFETPYVAIAMTASLGVVFVLFLDFEDLANTFVEAIVPFYALAVAAVFTLRKRVDYDPPFRVPLYPIVPMLFVLATIFILVNAIVDPERRWWTLLVLGIIALGIPVYYLTVGKRAKGQGRRAEGRVEGRP